MIINKVMYMISYVYYDHASLNTAGSTWKKTVAVTNDNVQVLKLRKKYFI